MVTAYATVELAVDAMKLGATDFVRKPMTPETLRHAVAAALAKHGRRTAAGGAPVKSPTALESPAEIWTTNGFFIRQAKRAGVLRRSHRTIITSSSGEAPRRPEQRLSSRSTRRQWRRSLESALEDLGGAGGFWHRQAENALINYLWSEAALPEGGRLVIDRVSGPMVDEAMAWSGD